MYTQCPQCQAIFQITAEHLKAAGGDVRCGQCLTVFNALDRLSEELPEPSFDITGTGTAGEQAPDIDLVADQLPPEHDFDIEAALEALETMPLRDPDAVVDVNEFQVAEDVVEDMNALESQSEPLSGTAVVDTEFVVPPSESVTPTATEHTETHSRKTIQVPSVILDDLAQEKAERLRPSSTPWAVGSLLLMLVFLGQAVYFARDELARDPTLRPWLETACATVGCTLSRPSVMDKIEILGWDVRSHPVATKALVASTTLINNAPFAQPYPLLELRFSDMTGTPLAQRRFKPREYLPAGTDFQAGMAPDTPVFVELELMDPGSSAVNFEFHAVMDPRAASQGS